MTLYWHPGGHVDCLSSEDRDVDRGEVVDVDWDEVVVGTYQLVPQ